MGSEKGDRVVLKRIQTGAVLIIGFALLLIFVGAVLDLSLFVIQYQRLGNAVSEAASAAARALRDPTSPASGSAAGSAQRVSSIARQVIERAGIRPVSVRAEICTSPRLSLPASERPLDSAGRPFYLYDADGLMSGGNPDANSAERQAYEALCAGDERAKVRISAAAEAPTALLRFLGQPVLRFELNATGQSPTLDIILLIDTSERMALQTTYADWERIGLGTRYLPPVISPDDREAWNRLVTSSNAMLRSQNPPAVFTPEGIPPQAEPRPECRTAAWPRSAVEGKPVPDALIEEYVNYLGGEAAFRAHFGLSEDQPLTEAVFRGFVPTYDYFACCNDPNGDYAFDDLICQPFRQLRDQVEDFLQQTRFERGDRVAIITYDRRAFLVDPDGAGDQTPMFDALTDGADTVGILSALRTSVGVRSETSFYVDGELDNPLVQTTIDDNDGRWDAFFSAGSRITWGDFNGAAVGSLLDSPVAGNCPFDMAGMEPMVSIVDFYPDGRPRPPTLLDDIATFPDWIDNPTAIRFNSYEYAASCGGANLGAALREAAAALRTYGRRENSIWAVVIVAGTMPDVSSPVPGEGSTRGASGQLLPAAPANPYSFGVTGQFIGLRGQYGGFGVCPYGTQGMYSRLLRGERVVRCSDDRPETRHFCSALLANPDTAPVVESAGCDVAWYDVDDYVRDWADWVILANAAGQAARGIEHPPPLIFTINFDQSLPLEGASPEPALLEALLRYIADLGDNARIDDDYQQRLMGERIPNGVQAATGDWGPRGPCEQLQGQRGIYGPLQHSMDCGNYRFAEDESALAQAFRSIHERLQLLLGE